jgi:hypothetical protein
VATLRRSRDEAEVCAVREDFKSVAASRREGKDCIAEGRRSRSGMSGEERGEMGEERGAGWVGEVLFEEGEVGCCC